MVPPIYNGVALLGTGGAAGVGCLNCACADLPTCLATWNSACDSRSVPIQFSGDIRLLYESTYSYTGTAQRVATNAGITLTYNYNASGSGSWSSVANYECLESGTIVYRTGSTTGGGTFGSAQQTITGSCSGGATNLQRNGSLRTTAVIQNPPMTGAFPPDPFYFGFPNIVFGAPTGPNDCGGSFNGMPPISLLNAPPCGGSNSNSSTGQLTTRTLILNPFFAQAVDRAQRIYNETLPGETRSANIVVDRTQTIRIIGGSIVPSSPSPMSTKPRSRFGTIPDDYDPGDPSNFRSCCDPA